jgi:exopolyphosphatase / guanosine-5'-triphosphate,3'-diphosphate pyrophosphatase
LKLLRFAAIDIGSNAIRLLFSNVVEDGKNTTFRKSSLIRVPLRLGEDSFATSLISKKKIDRLISTMQAFRLLMEVHDVISYRACATSAMREAKNGKEVVEKVKKETGIDIEIIDGREEAEIIYANQIVELINDEKYYLYVDVGGGSTEISLFGNKKMIDSNSFNIGTVRILSGKVSKSSFTEMKDWIKNLNIGKKDISLIGSGGNINKIYKLAGRKENQKLHFDELNEIFKFINYYTLEERIKVLGLNPDRADVIIPASDIYLKVMKWSGAKQIIVPTIGVSDGIIHNLYSDYKSKKKRILVL